MVVMKNKEEDENKNLVYGLKLSSAVPGKMTGDNKSHELTGMDLAVKLHYLKGVYFFTNNKNNNNNDIITSIVELKVPMSEWLVSYFKACGRIRKRLPETDGRPVIKLNDAGIRVVEARSTKTVDEWLAMDDFLSLQDQLIYHRPLGPDLAFSPLVFIQVTWFKCGGISLGLSWAHVLGDVLSASTFINMLGQYMQGPDHHQAKTLAFPDTPKPKSMSLRPDPKPRSMTQIDPVGDYWVGHTKTKMATYSFHLTSNQLAQSLLKVHGPNYGTTNKEISQCGFEIISAIIWKSIAKVRKDLEPTKVVTICSNPKSLNREQMIPHNDLKIGIIEANYYSILEIDLLKLVSLITDNMMDESSIIEESIEENMGSFDYILYGANLTFINMEEADIYGFELKGQFPVFASYSISGVGEKGAVLVLPGPKSGKNKYIIDKVVTLILPEDELEELKHELKKVWYLM